jgi:hypothetical protein
VEKSAESGVKLATPAILLSCRGLFGDEARPRPIGVFAPPYPSFNPNQMTEGPVALPIFLGPHRPVASTKKVIAIHCFEEVRFAGDSPLEESGFEPLVPR